MEPWSKYGGEVTGAVGGREKDEEGGDGFMLG